MLYMIRCITALCTAHGGGMTGATCPILPPYSCCCMLLSCFYHSAAMLLLLCPQPYAMLWNLSQHCTPFTHGCLCCLGMVSRAMLTAFSKGDAALFETEVLRVMLMAFWQDFGKSKVGTAWVYACMRVCAYARMRVCAYARMRACMRVCVHVRVYACMHVCMYACLCVCVFVCLRVCVFVCLRSI